MTNNLSKHGNMMNIKVQRQHAISPYLYMQFAEPLSNTDSSVDAAWDYLFNRWQPAFIEELKRLSPPMIRWGGCFASYYHWQEAVGPRDKRVPMLNLCWDGLYANQVGTDEVMTLCREANAEPLLVVNFESDGRGTWAHPLPGIDRCGTAEEAAEWVAYCNDPDNRLRQANGIKDPYHVTYWQIGNETSYGYPTVGLEVKHVRDGFTCAQNIAVSRRFAQAMRAVDPSLKLICWGDDGWAPSLCEANGDLFDLVAFHVHFPYSMSNGGAVLADHFYRQDPEKVWSTMLDTWKQLDRRLAAMKEQVAPYGKRLAMTEGHYGIADGRDRCDVLSSWTAGVAYARNLITIERYSDVLDIATQADFFGNRWQVNAMMLFTPMHQGKPYLLPVGEVMGLFSQHTGHFALPVQNTETAVEATASVSADGRHVYVHLVNTCPDHSVSMPVALDDALIKSATAWEIAEDPLMDIDVRNRGVFHPQMRRIDCAAYQLPAAGVAALDIELV